MSVYRRCSACRGERTVDRSRRCSRCGARDRFTWVARVELPPAPDGRRRQRRLGGFDTRQEAEAAERQHRQALEDRTIAAPAKTTIREWLEDHYLADLRHRVKPKTWADRQLAVRYVVERLGDRRLQSLSGADLDRLYTALLTGGRTRARAGAGDGLSAASVRRVHVVVKQALDQAVRHRMLATNPAADATPPSTAAVTADRRRAMRVWTRDELATFLQAAASDRFAALWSLTAMTGLRRSEALGLTWRSVDLDAGRLAVRATLQVVRGELHLEDATKSAGSARTVDLDPRTVAVLRERRRQQLEHRLAAGPAWVDRDLVFTWEDGRPLNPDWVTHRFVELTQVAGVPRIRLHDLRHTHATLMQRRGVASGASSSGGCDGVLQAA